MGTAQTRKNTPAKTARTTRTVKKPQPKAPVPTNKDIENLKKEKSTVQKRIKQNESQLRTTKNNVREELNHLVTINGEIGAKQRQINGISQRVDSLRGSITTLSGQVAQLERELAECKRKYQRGVMSIYRDKLMNNKLMFLFSAKNFHSMYLRMRYMSEFSRYQRAQGEIVKQKEQALQLKRNQLNVKKGQQEVLLAQGRSEKQVLEGQKVERQKVVNGLQQKQQELSSVLEADRVKMRNLDSKIDQLIRVEMAKAEKRRKEEAARRQREAAAKAAREKAERERREAAAKASKPETPTTASTNTATASAAKPPKPAATPKPAPKPAPEPKFQDPADPDRVLSANFAANKGRLPMPITGSYHISGHFGSNTIEGLSGVSIPNSGISITGKPGAQAKCVFNGEVSAVFSYGGMTNVIVRHGSYVSVYCDLSSACVRSGQKVSTGQILGNVARDARGNCTLQFQIRKETTKLNPAAWVR